MKKSNLVLCVSGALVAALGSFALNAEAWPIVIQPSINIGIPVPVVVAPAPPVYVAPAPVYVDPGPVVEYQPSPFDIYITAAAPADIVFVGGATYVWVTDSYGHRVQRFYGRGDHRDELFRRQAELHRVEARNGGHLPPRGETHAEAMAHEQQRVASTGRPGGPAPGAPSGYNRGAAPAPAAQHGGNNGGNNGHEHEHEHEH